MKLQEKTKRWHMLVPWTLFFITLLVVGYLLHQISITAKASSSGEITDIINEVGRLVILPQGEVPTIATITDLSKLKGQPFFDNAKVGDKVLIYTKAQKAILYDPASDKIVEIAPLSTK
jgi:hypothetical protein